MKIFILILCLLWLFLGYREDHICKSKYLEQTGKFWSMLCSLLGILIDGVCWYWLFKMIGL